MTEEAIMGGALMIPGSLSTRNEMRTTKLNLRITRKETKFTMTTAVEVVADAEEAQDSIVLLCQSRTQVSQV